MKRAVFYAFAMILVLASFTHKATILATSLRITIIDYVGNVVEGANVSLFATEEDYRNETNQVVDPQISDSKGRVTFKKLEQGRRSLQFISVFINGASSAQRSHMWGCTISVRSCKMILSGTR